MKLRLVSITGRAAKRWVALYHRHLPNVTGGLFAVGVAAGDELVGVAIAGHPPCVWMPKRGWGGERLVITRVATDGSANACSMLYGAICRGAKHLGWHEVWTYTLPEEPGTSLRAAGFEDMGLTAGGEHDRASRRRRPAVRADPKRRWRRVLVTTVDQG